WNKRQGWRPNPAPPKAEPRMRFHRRSARSFSGSLEVGGVAALVFPDDHARDPGLAVVDGRGKPFKGELGDLLGRRIDVFEIRKCVEVLMVPRLNDFLDRPFEIPEVHGHPDRVEALGMGKDFQTPVMSVRARAVSGIP